MQTAPEAPRWKNRIVAYRVMPVSEILENPKAWRSHPDAQVEALRSVLDAVGLVKPLIFNIRTGRLVDGKARLDLAKREGQEALPVVIVDLTEAEEALILATLDPLAALAEIDHSALAALLREVETDDVFVMGMLADLASEADLDGLEAIAGEQPGSAEGDGVTPPSPEDNSGQDEGDADRSSTLRLLDVTIGEPRHEVKAGDVWRLGGRHVLVCLSVVDSWPQWVSHLDEDGAALCPFPGPFVPLSAKARERKLVLVQPDPYLAGHLLDRFADVHGEDGVELEARE